MSLVISELGFDGIDYSPMEMGGLDASMEFPTETITHSQEFLQREAAKVPAQPSVQSEMQSFFQSEVATPKPSTWAITQPGYKAPGRAAAPAPGPLMVPPPAKGEGLPTWAYVAGGGVALVVLALLFWPTARRAPAAPAPAPAPAVAGLGFGSCGCGRKRR